MRVTMMMFCVCMYDTVLVLYKYFTSAYGKDINFNSSCDLFFTSSVFKVVVSICEKMILFIWYVNIILVKCYNDFIIIIIIIMVCCGSS